MKYYMTVKLATVGFLHRRSGRRGRGNAHSFCKGVLSLIAESKRIQSKCIPYTITKMFKEIGSDVIQGKAVKRNVLANATFNYDVHRNPVNVRLTTVIECYLSGIWFDFRRKLYFSESLLLV